ncbi:MAG: response regulator transcription factor [Chloroflexi bacterium OHK40]
MPLAFTILVASLGSRVEEFLVAALSGQGYEVRSALGLEQLLTTVSRTIDLVLLDIPDEDGLAHLGTVRAASQGALVVLGPRRNDRLLVAALEQGADDYVPRPFRTDELLARIRAQLRRRQRNQGAAISFGRFHLDPHSREASFDGTPLTLSAEEFALLTTLAARPGHLYPADTLVQQIWGSGQDATDHLASAIERLRGMIEADPRSPSVLGGDMAHGFWIGGAVQERELNAE